jgi:kynureninase
MTSMTAEEVRVCDYKPGSDALLTYRVRFPILEQTNYLISNSLGAVPAAVGPSLQSYFDLWATRGVRAWEEGWWTMAADLGDLVAPLIGANQRDVVFQPTVTLAHAVIFSAFEFARGRKKIVTDAMHFPSILYLINEQQRLAPRLRSSSRRTGFPSIASA